MRQVNVNGVRKMLSDKEDEMWSPESDREPKSIIAKIKKILKGNRK